MLSCVQLFGTPWNVTCGLLCPWNLPGKNTGVGCHALLPGNFLTQGSDPLVQFIFPFTCIFFGFFHQNPIYGV